MKVLFTRFPLESAHGGAEIQTLSLMKGLKERGHAVAFLGSCPVLLKETAGLHLPHAKLEIGPPPVTKWAAATFFWRKKRMRKQLESALSTFEGLDAIFMLSLTEKLLMTEWATKRGIKVFWVEHDRIGPWLTRNPWLPMLKRQSEFATTICVSELSKKMYVDLGWNPEKVIVIPNGIDPERFGPLPSPPPLRQGEGTALLHIGCVARLSHEKGVDVLIDAVGTMTDVSLTIVGTGPEEGFLRNMLATIRPFHHLTGPHIKIIPHVPDLSSFYHSIDALVLPSRDHDPFGMVTAEAMMLGVPVIVTDECGIAEYLTHDRDALIVKAGDAVELRSAIERLRDPELRSKMKAAGSETAHQKFLAKNMVDAYARLL